MRKMLSEKMIGRMHAATAAARLKRLAHRISLRPKQNSGDAENTRSVLAAVAAVETEMLAVTVRPAVIDALFATIENLPARVFDDAMQCLAMRDLVEEVAKHLGCGHRFESDADLEAAADQELRDFLSEPA